jgi:C-methyltransferase C-terminal domain/Putative zinc binding domain/Methyltransferase domain
MKRTSCSACGSSQLELILDLGTSPIADAYAKTSAESLALERYPLQLAVCEKCWLVQLLEVLPQEQLFGTGYSFYTSASPPLSRYHEDYANMAICSYTELADRFTVEIGCNDGDLLRHFAAAGCRTMGIDPAEGPMQVARDRGLDVRFRPFSLRYAQDIVEAMPKAGLVIANHVLAHVADVSDFLAGVALLLDDDGVALIEVQYLSDLLVNNAFDLVYHEHRNFFSLTSLELALSRHGLRVTRLWQTDRQGGSLRVEVRRATSFEPAVRRLRSSELWLQNMGAYEGLQGRVNRIRMRLRDLVEREGLKAAPVLGYGAPAKATTLLNFCHITDLPYAVDTTAAKQNRFIPGTSTQIIGPEYVSGSETFLLLAWNYMSKILRDNHHARWIVPIPSPVIL